MKKIAVLSVVALTASSFVPVISIDIAHAQSAGAAFIGNNSTCTGFIPNPDHSVGAPLNGPDSQTVSNNGNQTRLMCHFTIPAGEEPATATHAAGFLCSTYAGLTNISQMTATPGGNAALTCWINGNNPSNP
jgi:hypothetical protein